MAEESKKHSMFISLTHTDRAIADAIKDAVKQLFGELVEVYYSTSKEQGEGIKPGEEWFQWIKDRVKEADIALILLTPASVQKPWILWEAGAVTGVSMATTFDSKNPNRVLPVVYQLKTNEIPSPFHNIQIIRGDKKSDIKQLFETFLEDFGKSFTKAQAFKAGQLLEGTINNYLKEVNHALLNAPILPTESAVQEWCLRLDELKDQNRPSETKYLHDWINATFGRDENEAPVPIDVRIHRRLGRLYMDAKNYEKAAEQYELAKRIVPRDLFIIRRVGQAYLKKKDFEITAKVIERIGELDKNAFVHNVECAALKGKWYREQGDLTSAEKVFTKARANNPDSYYLTDLLGQVTLEKGDIEKAKGIYKDLLRILERLNELNLWAHSSGACASIVNENEDHATYHLQEIARFSPSKDKLETIEDSLKVIQEKLGLEDEKFNQWKRLMRGKK
jgi:tetratricopeptide (TPR) repeat protein